LANSEGLSKRTALVLSLSHNHAKIAIDNVAMAVTLPGRWRLESSGIKPLAPGDFIVLSGPDSGLKIVDILSRRNEFTRQTAGPKPAPQTIAVNLDLVIIVASFADPSIPFGLVDRLIVTATAGGIESSLIVNKLDLVSKAEVDRWRDTYTSAVNELIFTSAIAGMGIDRLATLLKSRTTLMVGASGVGKSSLVNRMDPGLKIKTGEISQSTGKGRHITSLATLHPLTNGGWLADSPGLRECAPWNLTRESLIAAYPEIARLTDQCRFRNCLHHGETGCAVELAAGTPELPSERYHNYLKLLSEIET
jgi:ribosome biogenesis GTPase